MDEKTIWITPFIDEKVKMAYVVGKFMAGAGIKGYHVLLTGPKKIPADDEDERK